MEKEILGYGLLLKIKNDFEEGFPNEYTKFGFNTSKETLLSKKDEIIDNIMDRLTSFSKTDDAIVSGCPFSFGLNEEEFLETITHLKTSIKEHCSMESLNNAISKIEKSKEKLIFGVSSKSYLSTGKEFTYDYEIVLYPILSGEIGVNFIPYCHGF